MPHETDGQVVYRSGVVRTREAIVNKLVGSITRLLCLALVIVAPGLSLAQDAGQGLTRSYAGLKLGAVIPQHSDLDGYDSGFAIEGFVGHAMNDNFAVEVSLGRFSLSGSSSGFDPGLGAVVTVTSEVVAYPLLVTGKVIAPLDNVELYGLFGAGLYFISGDLSVSAPGYVPASRSDSDTATAVHLGAGMNYRVSSNARLGAEFKYLIGKTGLYSDITGEKSNFDSLMIGASLSFRL
jgi:opacity protein-like surface antigen